MTIFGDDEPEDAWAPEDPFGLLLDNLYRRLALLEAEPITVYRHALLDVLQVRVYPLMLRRADLGDRDRVRVDQLIQDLNYLRGLLSA
jgi:hypothetical protein